MSIVVNMESKYDADHGWYFPPSPVFICNTRSLYQVMHLDIDEARSLAHQLELVIAQYDQKKGE